MLDCLHLFCWSQQKLFLNFVASFFLEKAEFLSCLSWMDKSRKSGRTCESVTIDRRFFFRNLREGGLGAFTFFWSGGFESVFCVLFYHNSMIDLPSQAQVDNIVEGAVASLRGRLLFDEDSKVFRPKICASCDRIHTIDNPIVGFSLNRFEKLLKVYPAKRAEKKWDGRSDVLNQYRANHKRLEPFLLSPYTKTGTDELGDEVVLVCQECLDVFEEEEKKKGPKSGPGWSIWNGSMFGRAPECLTCLNEAELNLVSLNRCASTAIVLRSDAHKGLYGWHSVFQSDAETNASNIKLLKDSGFQSDFMCVLCGPFSKVHLKKAKEMVQVRSDKVLEAYAWLCANNPYYKDCVLPSENELTSPRLVRHSTL